MTSLSTRFLGQPKLTKPTLVGFAGFWVLVHPGRATTVVDLRAMQSFDFSIQGRMGRKLAMLNVRKQSNNFMAHQLRQPLKGAND